MLYENYDFGGSEFTANDGSDTSLIGGIFGRGPWNDRISSAAPIPRFD